MSVNMYVYCMECGRLGCEKAEPIRTGFVIINLATGEKDAKGTQVNAGYHPKATETSAQEPEPQEVQI